jgi:hypothetical protein
VSRAQNIRIENALNRIGAVNIPADQWQVVDAMFPSVLVGDISKLVAIPKAPAATCGFFYAGVGALWRCSYLLHDDRDIVVHNLYLRLTAFSNYGIYAGICPKSSLVSRLMIDNGNPEVPLNVLFTAGDRATARAGATVSPTNPATWPAGELWHTNMLYGTSQTRELGIEWLIPAGFALILWGGPVANFGFVASYDWHEQPAGALGGSYTLT